MPPSGTLEIDLEAFVALPPETRGTGAWIRSGRPVVTGGSAR